MKTAVLLSGGLDSTVLLGQAVLEFGGDNVLAISVNYRQRHARELQAAERVAAHYSTPRLVVDLTGWGSSIAGSSQTDPSVAVPEGHYAEESMKATVVPYRNAVMIACAAGIAVSRGCSALYYAAHSGDHAIYPDCRPEFVEAMARLLAVSDWSPVRLAAPFVGIDKAEIVRRGAAFGVPMGLTWSCYKGGEKHCGKCGTCVERREAFALAGVADPTEYEL